MNGYKLDKTTANGKIADDIIRYRYRLIGLENQLIKEIVSEFKEVYKQIDELLDNKNPFLLKQLSGVRLYPSPFMLKDADDRDNIPVQNIGGVVEQLTNLISQMIHGLINRISYRIQISEMELADTQPEIFANIVNNATPKEVTPTTLHVFVSIIRNTRFMEATKKKSAKTLVDEHYSKTISKVAKQLNHSLHAGKSVRVIRSEVKGVIGKNLVGPAAKIARTQIQKMATQAAKEFYDQNQNIIEAEIWLATLDKRTCLICGGLDGREFPVGKGPQPVDDTHPNCRCIRVPKVKSWEALGIDPATLPAGARHQLDGVAPERVTFENWFSDQDEKVQREILGATRYELFAGGDLDITDFVKNNKLLSIKQLRKAYKLK